MAETVVLLFTVSFLLSCLHADSLNDRNSIHTFDILWPLFALQHRKSRSYVGVSPTVLCWERALAIGVVQT